MAAVHTRILALTALLLGGGAIASHFLANRHADDLDAMRDDWRAERHDTTERVARGLDGAIGQIYAGIRTISRLPGVRAALAGRTPLDADATATVQELYNNLASAVDMSEVYLVPPDVDPDATPPREPLVTFDELIVGRHDDEATGGAEAEGAEELETYEYRLMKRQLAWFAQNAPTSAAVDGLRVPLLSGPEVITCDNRHFDPHHPDDARRSGFVFTVPVYDGQGQLVGAVSGIILSDVLRALLPDEGHVLIGPDQHVLVGPTRGQDWTRSQDEIEAGVPDGTRLYSEVVPLTLPDRWNAWKVWAGAPDADFVARPDVLAAETFYTKELAAVWGTLGLGLLAGGGLLWRADRQARRVERVLTVAAEAAAGQIFARTELSGEDNVGRLAGALDDVLDSVGTMVQVMIQADESLGKATGELGPASSTIASVAQTTRDRAEAAARSVGRVSGAVAEVASGVSELDSTIREVVGQTADGQKVAERAVEAAAKAGDVVQQLAAAAMEIGRTADVINDFAEKTRMLSLNASVEAARAGKAGEGFNVVAREVKELAMQTATAAATVHEQVSRIEAEGRRARDAMGQVRTVMRDLAERQRAVAELMQHQAAAATQVGAGAARAADEASHIRNAVDAAADAAVEAARAANVVADISTDVLGTAGSLRDAVSQVKAA